MLLLAPWARTRTPSMVVLRGTPRNARMVRSGPTGNVKGRTSISASRHARGKISFFYRGKVYPVFLHKLKHLIFRRGDLPKMVWIIRSWPWRAHSCQALAPPINHEKSGGAGRLPAALGGTGFHWCADRQDAGAPRTFQGRDSASILCTPGAAVGPPRPGAPAPALDPPDHPTGRGSPARPPGAPSRPGAPPGDTGRLGPGASGPGSVPAARSRSRRGIRAGEGLPPRPAGPGGTPPPQNP